MNLHRENLLGGPPPTHLPEDGEAAAALTAAVHPKEAAARFPSHPGAWASLAERSYDADEPVQAYAYARTGYHRGLDQLRRAGWKGHGPIPWEHGPNQGFLRALHMLSLAAAAIGELDEAQRCATLLRESSTTAVEVLNEERGGS